MTTIDLTGFYAREFVAHMLCGEAHHLMEGADHLDGPEVPWADTTITNGLHETLSPYMELLECLAKIHRTLELVQDTNVESVEWPLEQDVLVEGSEECVTCIREALSDLPAETLETLVSAVVPAEAFRDSLTSEAVA